jgi:hypothetical protein
MAALSKCHPYDVMPVYLEVVLHHLYMFYPKLGISDVKLYRNVRINGNELHGVRVISWKSTIYM